MHAGMTMYCPICKNTDEKEIPIGKILYYSGREDITQFMLHNMPRMTTNNLPIHTWKVEDTMFGKLKVIIKKTCENCNSVFESKFDASEKFNIIYRLILMHLLKETEQLSLLEHFSDNRLPYLTNLRFYYGFFKCYKFGASSQGRMDPDGILHQCFTHRLEDYEYSSLSSAFVRGGFADLNSTFIVIDWDSLIKKIYKELRLFIINKCDDVTSADIPIDMSDDLFEEINNSYSNIVEAKSDYATTYDVPVDKISDTVAYTISILEEVNAPDISISTVLNPKFLNVDETKVYYGTEDSRKELTFLRVDVDNLTKLFRSSFICSSVSNPSGNRPLQRVGGSSFNDYCDGCELSREGRSCADCSGATVNIPMADSINHEFLYPLLNITQEG
jgi:hypothetical protein